MKIGTTSFGFRYAFLDAARAPKLSEMIRQAREAGIERLQICENTRPLEASAAEWREAHRCAEDFGVELQLGGKTLSPVTAERYIQLAEEQGFKQLRLVMEDPDHHETATRETVVRLLEATVPRMQRAGLQLAIENHFDIAAKLLIEVTADYPKEVVGFCVDTANSLRSFEPTSEVFRLLGERAVCYHLKDYRVIGSMVNFSVIGAPLGEGQLDLAGCLKDIFSRSPVPPLYVETWTPSENDREKDIALDAEWVRRSVKNLREHLAQLPVVATA